jgi:lipid-binding SYLF domain-containing protein
VNRIQDLHEIVCFFVYGRILTFFGRIKMKTSITVLLAICLTVAMSGCSRAVGNTADEKRAYAQKMKKDTIAELYEKKPQTKAKIASAAGYGVFSNININLFLLSSGNGYGIVHNQSNGEETYMRMQMLGVGLGLGAKDFRAVIIFKTDKSLKTFTEKGWEWGGHADAAAKSGEKGGAVSGAGDITQDMEIYTFTESGIALQATVAGTKYWRDKELSPRPEDKEGQKTEKDENQN